MASQLQQTEKNGKKIVRGSRFCWWENMCFSYVCQGKMKETITHCLTLTEQMAAGDTLLGKRGLQSRNGGGENVRLLKHLRSMWSIQWAEHSAVVQLHPLVEFNYRELVPPRFGAPVFILQRDTSGSEITGSSGRCWRFLFPYISQCAQCNVVKPFCKTAVNQKHVLNMKENCTHHHPVFRMYNMDWSFCLSLNGLMDDATSHPIDQDDADKASLLMQVRALGHQSQQVGVQILSESRWNT